MTLIVGAPMIRTEDGMKGVVEMTSPPGAAQPGAPVYPSKEIE